jgi:hypothetical protein
MTGLAASIVRLWVRLYTAGLEATTRERIRQEVETDLWEQINGKDAAGKPSKEAVIIILRWILGVPADIQWTIEEHSSGDLAMRSKKFMSAVAQKRSWFILLIVLAFLMAMIFLGIGAFIFAGVLIIALQPRRVQQILNRL